MTRIMFWNIENFGLKTIHDPSSAATVMQSAVRLAMIRAIVLAAGPHIIVVAECSSRNDEVGKEGTPIAAAGVMRLLAEIRGVTGNVNWALIPPSRLGTYRFQEAIGVFYDAAVVRFVGPYVWGADYRTAGRTRQGTYITRPEARACPAADSMPPVGYNLPGAVVGPQLYDANWNGCLPARAVPAGLPNAGVSEDRLAGRWEHHAGGNQLGFPAAYNRSPLLTQFHELATNRLLSVYAIHTSPGQGWADRATEYLANIPEIAAASPLNCVDVVVGDFNVDSFGPMAAAYNSLVNLNFQIKFDPRVGGVVQPALKPLLMTHYLPVRFATPFSGPAPIDARHNVYPRFGYMGSGTPANGFSDSGAIDNAFVRYGAGAVPGGALPQPTIVNAVVGSPYVAAGGAGAGLPLGSVAYPATLTNAIPAAGEVDPDPAGGGMGPFMEPGRFQQWNNFGRVHSTSDHLPIVFDA